MSLAYHLSPGGFPLRQHCRQAASYRVEGKETVMGAKQSWMTRMSRGIIFVVMLQLLTLMSNGVGASLAVSQTKLAYFDGIVSVAGFDASDGFKHVIVAQKDGTINEVFYDDSGIYSGILTHLDGVVGVAG